LEAEVSGREAEMERVRSGLLNEAAMARQELELKEVRQKLEHEH
jgi:hypothetical protein